MVTQYKTVPPAVRDINQVCAQFLEFVALKISDIQEWAEVTKDGTDYQSNVIEEKLSNGLDPNGICLRVRFRLCNSQQGTFGSWIPQTVKIHKGMNGRTIYKLGERELERNTVAQLIAIYIARSLKGR